MDSRPRGNDEGLWEGDAVGMAASGRSTPLFVIPAEAGVRLMPWGPAAGFVRGRGLEMDSRLRGNDEGMWEGDAVGVGASPALAHSHEPHPTSLLRCGLASFSSQR